MFVRPRMLSIFTTRRCTAACDHCCVGASPRATCSITVERIHRLIDEAKRIPSLELIGFTGGECFLLGDDLDELVGHAKGNGFATRVISNGYWAVNERAARGRIGGLRARGLDEMMLSTGTFHQRFVPVERIIHAARAAADAGVLTRISIEECDQSSFDDALLLADLAEPIAKKQVYVAHSPWTPDAGGRGQTSLSHERWFADHAPRPVGRCAQVLTVIAVTPEQQLVSCCGFPLEELPQLRIGSVAESALDDVLDEAPNELLKMWLHVAGPSGIADFVAQHVPGYALPPSASICQSCVSLQRDQNAMRVIAEHAGEIVQSVANAYYQLQAGAA